MCPRSVVSTPSRRPGCQGVHLFPRQHHGRSDKPTFPRGRLVADEREPDCWSISNVAAVGADSCLSSGSGPDRARTGTD